MNPDADTTTVYHLCVAYSKEKLEQGVNELLKNGWLLLGSLQFSTGLVAGHEYEAFAQPMVKTVRK